jgi:hypothetical protein
VNPQDSPELPEQARRLLDEHAEALDGATRSGLRRARALALESWAFATTGAAAATAALALFLAAPWRAADPLPQIYQDPLQQAVVEDMDLLDDMDVLMWLVAEEGVDSAAPNS